jgi:hypothetical protein
VQLLSEHIPDELEGEKNTDTLNINENFKIIDQNDLTHQEDDRNQSRTDRDEHINVEMNENPTPTQQMMVDKKEEIEHRESADRAINDQSHALGNDDLIAIIGQ